MNEDVLDCSCCSLCGMYFEDPEEYEPGKHAFFDHDESVVCWDCWKGLSEKDKKLHTRTRVKVGE